MNLPVEMEQCMFPGSGPSATKDEKDAKKVMHRGAPILCYERGLLDTVLAQADYGVSDLMDNHHTLFLKDLSDLQVHTNTVLLEQVTDLAHWKMVEQMPKIAWETLQMFQFGEGEEALWALHKYLESANGWNTRFLEKLRQEGVRPEMLARLNDLGGILPQVQPIGSVAVLLAATTALVQSRGTAVYSAEVIQEVTNIQEQLSEDLRKQFFTL